MSHPAVAAYFAQRTQRFARWLETLPLGDGHHSQDGHAKDIRATGAPHAPGPGDGDGADAEHAGAEEAESRGLLAAGVLPACAPTAIPACPT